MKNGTLNTLLFFDTRWQQYTLEINISQTAEINIRNDQNKYSKENNREDFFNMKLEKDQTILRITYISSSKI